MINKHQSSTLEIIAAAVAVAIILALSLVVLVVQEANAAMRTRFSFNQVQDSTCGGFAGCSNIGTITLRLGHGGPDHN